MLGIDFALWARSIEMIGAGIATVVVNVQVVVVPLLAWLVFRERVPVRFVLAVPFLFAGVALAGGALFGGGETDRSMWGTLLALAAGLAYGTYLFVAGRAGSERRASSQVFVSTLVAGVVGTSVGSLWGPVDLTPGWPALGWLAMLALSGQVLGWVLIGIGLPPAPVRGRRDAVARSARAGDGGWRSPSCTSAPLSSSRSDARSWSPPSGSSAAHRRPPSGTTGRRHPHRSIPSRYPPAPAPCAHPPTWGHAAAHSRVHRCNSLWPSAILHSRAAHRAAAPDNPYHAPSPRLRPGADARHRRPPADRHRMGGGDEVGRRTHGGDVRRRAVPAPQPQRQGRLRDLPGADDRAVGAGSRPSDGRRRRNRRARPADRGAVVPPGCRAASTWRNRRPR